MTAKHKFPIGAWVVDVLYDNLSSGGLENGKDGNVFFRPSGGEVVSLIDRPFAAYKIAYGGAANVLLDSHSLVCYGCQAPDDTTHHNWCPYSPVSPVRTTPHDAGYAI